MTTSQQLGTEQACEQAADSPASLLSPFLKDALTSQGLAEITALGYCDSCALLKSKETVSPESGFATAAQAIAQRMADGEWQPHDAERSEYVRQSAGQLAITVAYAAAVDAVMRQAVAEVLAGHPANPAELHEKLQALAVLHRLASSQLLSIPESNFSQSAQP